MLKLTVNQFSTNIYRKPTFSGVNSSFSSFMPEQYKLGLVFTLLNRIFNITSTFSKFHVETSKLREVLMRNGYTSHFVDKCIKSFLNKMFLVKEVVLTVPKKEVFIVLPYLGTESLRLRTRLCKLIAKYLPACKLKVVFKCDTRISSFFKFKDRVIKSLRSKVVYKFTCGGCNASYIGKTMRHLNVRASEHVGISALTQKRVKSKRSAVSDHLLTCDSIISFPTLDDFSILATANSNFILELKESLLIHRDNPPLNFNESSVPLYLFN